MKRRYPEYKGEAARQRSEEIDALMTEVVNKAVNRIETLTGQTPISRVTVNRDLTVDAEITLIGATNWDEVRNLADAISIVAPGTNIPESWIQIGAKTPVRAGEIVTGIPTTIGHKSAERYATYWQFSRRAANNALNFRYGIIDKLRKMRRRMPREIYIRIHWNPKGEKPEGR